MPLKDIKDTVRELRDISKIMGVNYMNCYLDEFIVTADIDKPIDKLPLDKQAYIKLGEARAYNKILNLLEEGGKHVEK